MKRVVPVAAACAALALAFTLRTGNAAPSSPAIASEPAPALAPVQAPALDDATIVAIFDAANGADIETGELAAKKGSTKAVRDFGATLARDHKAVQKQGRDLARKLGVTPTPPKNDKSAADHAAVMKKLNGLSGAAFDKAFLEHEVAFHDAVLDAVKTTLMPAIKNAELKDLVQKVAPAFVAHRDMAKHLLAN